jgi:hypothetical protein
MLAQTEVTVYFCVEATAAPTASHMQGRNLWTVSELCYIVQQCSWFAIHEWRKIPLLLN